MKVAFNREDERLEVLAKLAGAPMPMRAALIEEYSKRSEAAFAPGTRRCYHQIIRSFKGWCAENGHDGEPPVSPIIVAEYVDALGGKIRATTIENRLWAIAEMHRSAFEVSPCRHRLVELALMSVKRKYGAAVRQAPALGKKDVLAAIDRLGDSPAAVRNKALLWILTDSWCRASELVAFKVRDICRQEDGTSLLFVSRSKTDPYGQGAYAFLSEAGTMAALQWIELADLEPDDPLITKSQPGGERTPLNTATVSRIIKRCIGRKDVSAHSMRVGGVQDAFRIGCDLSSIMVAGRWSSPEMPARYGRRILASQSAAAQVSNAYGVTTEPEKVDASNGK
ncbi:tyrosine-type recombinase/integrase [Psychromarinibacter sp. C21-152]|uniref:Tyrosine-type recombinase/integrase n=1 Tax=Psychromarinibacter sediminicola TaxID=3033385 RepID=A0AAE3NX14_9RHOB|nr:tyrosine-type recombinase/integrase [Psychromarinibacter sediminicola]MDF0603861.1 tyrosine-type recombinase/integrase [Psychromarinibacter sediminicola]